MDLPGFDVTPEAREMLADYGETMLQVQLFQYALLGLVNAQEDEPAARGTEDDARRIESLFRLTAGQLRNRAKITDAEFAELLQSTVKLRNGLAHHWLIFNALDLIVGRATEAKQRETLHAAARSIQIVREALVRRLDEVLADLGEEPIPPEVALQMLRDAPRPE